MKTNAVRILDNLNIKYELVNYDVDPDDLTAETVASKVGLPVEQVFKTLALIGEKSGVILTVIAGNAQLDLKAAAKISGNKAVEMVPLKDVQKHTGYIRGGVTALACKKDYPVYVDEDILYYDVVSVSAGVRGTQIFLNPNDYVKATKGVIGQIAIQK
ncbi:Cys-tRNA(Pro) deacylase [bacterium]|nr:Cys-tRNA(Pro) deacylase [bacterium]QQR59237.1 MAG: Cys-tRNA(Pro) deacylase [Candidatus Melainabacteria bacterium]